MTITLGTNVPSLKITNNLDRTTVALSDTMERLSTGLKINCAKDDAAGLVISQNMEARIESSQQAQDNIETAENFLAIAEDGMVSISDHMQRINDLLTNMANDTNDLDSREASVREIIERLNEINRLARTTEFNGRNMLDGSTDSIIVQLGPDSTENSILDISSALSDCHTSALGIELTPELCPDLYSEGGKYYIEENGKYYEAEVTKVGDKLTAKYDKNGDIKHSDSETTLTNPQSEFNPTNANCREYMGRIQEAIGSLATNRGLLGAYENRLDSSYDSLAIRIESLQEAKGVYVDADVAEEATNYTSQQILEQMNVSLLSSANSLQQVALSLLG